MRTRALHGKRLERFWVSEHLVEHSHCHSSRLPLSGLPHERNKLLACLSHCWVGLLSYSRLNLIRNATTPLEIMLLSLPHPHPTNPTNLFALGLLLFSNVCLFFQFLNKQRNLDCGRGGLLRSCLRPCFPTSCHC